MDPQDRSLATIIQFPGPLRRPVVQQLTVRLPLGRRKQKVLSLTPGEANLDQKIQQAKNTAANCQDMADKARRDQATAQQEFATECERPHSQPEDVR